MLYAATFVLLFAVTFLLGSIPFGLIIAKVFYQTDLRQCGSGNIGTTNALRTMGKAGGAAVFVLDFGKGLLSGYLATLWPNLFVGWINSIPGQGEAAFFFAINPVQLNGVLLSLAFLGCVWGHIFSPWLKFKGGKGIAVAVGCLFFTFGAAGAVPELLIFAVLVILTRYVSVGSIAAAAACPFFSLYFFNGNPLAIVLCSAAAVTVVWAHRGNIARLKSHTESRIGQKKKTEHVA